MLPYFYLGYSPRKSSGNIERNKMRILILDDNENRHKEFNKRLIGHVVKNVYTVEETIKYLEEEKWDFVFLDHDLGGKINEPSGPSTGYEVARWLQNNPNRQPDQIVIHSYNPTGARNMKSLLPNALIFPGAWLYVK